MQAAALIGLERYSEAREALADAIPGLRKSENRHSLAIACKQMGDLLRQEGSDTAAYDNDVLQQENDAMRSSRRLFITVAGVLLVLLLLGWLLYARYMHRRQREQQQENARLQQLLDSMMEQNEARAKTETPDEEVQQPQSEEMRQFQLRIISIVNEQMAHGNISVDALASELCLSPAQLRSRIGELAGETPQNFILGIRMQKARHLLTSQPSMPIGTVALRCGYEEKASFSRAFKRYFGCSPSKFMEKQVE